MIKVLRDEFFSTVYTINSNVPIHNVKEDGHYNVFYMVDSEIGFIDTDTCEYYLHVD